MANNLKINAFSSVAQTLLNLALMVLLYRQIVLYLGTDRLGVWAIVLSSTTFFNLSNLGFAGGVTPFVSAYQAQQSTRRVIQTLQTASSFTASTTALLGVMAYPLIVWLLPFFIDTQYLSEAKALLPLAMMSFWFNTLGGVFLSGLDGLHKMYLRSALSSGVSIVYAALALLLVRPFGLQGMAYAQVAQAVLLALVAAYLLRRELPGWSPFSFRINPTVFAELFRYGLNFQVMYLAQIVSDPLTKLLAATFGNLQSVAFYEMGIKIVGIFRTIVAAANQAIVPTVATSTETPSIVGLYRQNLRIVGTLSLWIYPPFIWFGWLISEAWLGQVQPEFVLFLAIIAVAYGLNTLSLPVHYINLGTRQLRWNVRATAASAATMALLGMLMGWSFGATGVVVAWALSAGVGTWVLVGSFHRAQSLGWGLDFDRHDARMLLANLLMLGGGGLCYWLATTWPFWLKALACGVWYALLSAFALRHTLVYDYVRNLLAYLAKALRPPQSPL